MSMTTNADAAITAIIEDTYGKAAMPKALAADLIKKLPTWDESDRDREYEIMLTCWNWFSGGSTAESVARRIEEALQEAS